MQFRNIFTSTTVIIALAFLLAACGGGETDAPSDDVVMPTGARVSTPTTLPTAVVVLPEASGDDQSGQDAVAAPAEGAEPPTPEPATTTPVSEDVRAAFIVQAEPPAEEPVATPTTGEPITAPPLMFDEGCLGAAPVADVTIPDGSILEPGETFTKIWRLRNSGSCEWNEALGEFRWVFVSGDQMGGPNQVPIAGPVPPGAEYDVELELTAPEEAGTHEGRWQLQGPTGGPVGVLFWVLIEVSGTGSTAAPDDAPPSGGSATAPPATAPEMAQKIWELINGERDRHGLYQLAYNQKLAHAAQSHAEDCSQRDSCSHTGSDGSDEAVRVLREGYQGSVDESWAMAMSSGDAVFWWLDEVPPNDWHRRMLLSQWATEVGVGVAPAPAGYFFIAVFGITGH